MSGGSSSAAAWFTLLEPAPHLEPTRRRPDDPRLGELIAPWDGDLSALTPGRAVLVGFPVDTGVRRNGGRVGAAAAPQEIRDRLFRLSPWDGQANVGLTDCPPLDAGNLRTEGSLENAQEALAAVVAGLLAGGAVPVVLGGGHEMAFGHYLGYVAAGRRVGIINIDAHLDVRPWPGDHGHSGSPFRQAMEHLTQPLPGGRYVCLGAQPSAVGRGHLRYVREQGSIVRWADEVRGQLAEHLTAQIDRLSKDGCQVYVTLDADAVCAADVPGVSAPNPLGLAGSEVAACARVAGTSPAVASFDLVEINPRHDRDGQSARWAALVIWNFLVGVAQRP